MPLLSRNTVNFPIFKNPYPRVLLLIFIIISVTKKVNYHLIMVYGIKKILFRKKIMSNKYLFFWGMH